jgi:metallo-beta-lactamase class B
MRWGIALLLTTGAALAQPAPPPDVPGALPHIARARELAGKDHLKAVALCDPQGTAKFAQYANSAMNQWFEPTKAFDNIYYIGSEFVGVWVIKTSKGLILIDSMGSTEDARDHLVPGLKKLGLDPAQIKYVLVTHGHWDHYGGAQYLADTFGARIGLSEADWQLMARLQPGSPARLDRTPPHKDMVITDGMNLSLGDTTIALHVTPGHTPGTISAIIPARERGKTYPMSLLGGTAFPVTLEPNANGGGLLANSATVRRLAAISRAAGAVGLLNTHVSVDGSSERLHAAARRQPGQPNPFVIGADVVRRHYAIFDECLQAAIARKRAAPNPVIALESARAAATSDE